MKDIQTKFNDSQTSSQNSSSFSVEFVQGSTKMFTMPSFSKLQAPPSQLNSSNRINIKKSNFKFQLEGLFASETAPQKKIDRVADRSHLGFVVTPEKIDPNTPSHLPSSSIIFSPREVRSNNSPKISNYAQRQVYEKRIRQMTKDWGDQRSNLKKQIRQLEFIVQQWEMMDQRKNGSIVKQNLHSVKSLSAFDTTSIADGTQKQSAQILKLKQQLEEVEQERNQMMQDFADLEQQLKKIKPAVFEHSGISSLRFAETSRSDFEREIEIRVNEQVELVRQSYEKIIVQKDERYQELLQDFTQLQEELEKERSETMILLQKRTTELESNLTNLKVANDEINSELRCVIDRISGQLVQEKQKASTFEIQLSRKEQNCRMLENELSLVSKDLEELREVYMDKCIQFEVSKSEKPLLKIKKDVEVQTLKNLQRTIDVQVDMVDGRQIELQALKDERRILQHRLSNLESNLQERQARLNSAQNNIKEYIQTIKKLEISVNQLSQENAQLKGNVVETTIVNEELRSSRLSERSESSDWKVEKAVLKKELEEAKSELENSRRKLDTFRNEKHYEKIQVSSQDRLTRNKYEVQIHNLTSEVESMKIKMESMQARLDMRKKELKQKDDFIQNAIVARAGKNLNESEAQYFLKRLEEFTEVCRRARD